MVWSGVEWRGSGEEVSEVWCGVVWCGVVWCGVVWWWCCCGASLVHMKDAVCVYSVWCVVCGVECHTLERSTIVTAMAHTVQRVVPFP